MKGARVLITGCYGFLGFSIAMKLLELGAEVLGVDRLNGARSLKQDRVDLLSTKRHFKFVECDLSNVRSAVNLYRNRRVTHVLHLAAQYAVRHSTDAMESYGRNNCLAFLGVMEGANVAGIKHAVYASSTFAGDPPPPVHMYGATKIFNEHAANCFAHQGMSLIGLRYGSTFGPHCRPDVGVHQIAQKLIKRKPIDVEGSGFTYKVAFCDVDDAIGATLAALQTATIPFAARTFTVVANDYAQDLGDLLRMLEEATGIKADCDWSKYQEKPSRHFPHGAVIELNRGLGYMPGVSVREAVQKFAAWKMGQP